MKFTDVWKLPFVKDPEGYCIYIWDSNNRMCFNFLGDDYDLYVRIVKLLNGEEAQPFKGVGRDEETIAVSDDVTKNTAAPCLLVRGWGHLTGSLKLDAKEAIKLQNELIDYCVAKLHGKQKGETE